MKKNRLWQVVMHRPRCILRFCSTYAPLHLQKDGYHSNAARLLGQSANQNNPEKEYLLIGATAADEDYIDHPHQPSAPQHSHRAPPKGYVAVYVGSQSTRFIIPATYLSMPDFKDLMDKVAEEFGFEQPEGGLQIPCCEEADFQQILSRCRKNKKQKSNN